MAAAPTIRSSTCSTSNATTTTSNVAAQAGDLAVFLVDSGDASGVTASLAGGTSMVQVGSSYTDGTRYHRWFAVRVAAGNISGGNTTATVSGMSTGTVRRITLYIVAGQWSSDMSAAFFAGTSGGTTGSTTTTVTLSDDNRSGAAFAACAQGGTWTTQHTYAWDGAGAGAADFNGGSSAFTVASKMYGPTDSGESVTVANISSGQARVASIVFFRQIETSIGARPAAAAAVARGIPHVGAVHVQSISARPAAATATFRANPRATHVTVRQIGARPAGAVSSLGDSIPVNVPHLAGTIRAVTHARGLARGGRTPRPIGARPATAAATWAGTPKTVKRVGARPAAAATTVRAAGPWVQNINITVRQIGARVIGAVARLVGAAPRNVRDIEYTAGPAVPMWAAGPIDETWTATTTPDAWTANTTTATWSATTTAPTWHAEGDS